MPNYDRIERRHMRDLLLHDESVKSLDRLDMHGGFGARPPQTSNFIQRCPCPNYVVLVWSTCGLTCHIFADLPSNQSSKKNQSNLFC
mmetsp:Transcript_4434/g.9849  ORF Transcript_4434/g.9849 Transcript_4434/m.9849 type:complete len:87 (+) Transcript_4434:307-567(+)